MKTRVRIKNTEEVGFLEQFIETARETLAVVTLADTGKIELYPLSDLRTDGYECNPKIGPELTLITSENLDFSCNKTNLDHFFRDIYAAAFPDDNERENPEDIRRRLFSSQLRPETQTLCVLATDGSGHCTGGILADYHESSDILLVTYIAVDERKRKKGIGTKLFINGIQMICDHIRQHVPGASAEKIFLEVSIPGFGPDDFETDFERSEGRCQFFRSMGVVFLDDFDYVQPALSPDKAPVRYLCLCLHPFFPEGDVNDEDLWAFIKSIYSELNAEDTPEFKDYEKYFQ